MKEIPLNHGKVALVDDEDFNFLNQFKWYAVNTSKWCHFGYVMGYYPTKYREKHGIRTIYMHRLIMQPKQGFQIDHINGNSLDNRKENLRIVTNRENQHNLRDSSIRNYTSKYPGVSKMSSGRFRALIQIGGVNKRLGVFDVEIDAANAYAEECNLLKREEMRKW
jgi:hypothetical protein